MRDDEQTQLCNEESRPTKQPRVSASEQDYDDVHNRSLEKSAHKATVTLLHLPDELLAEIVHYLYVDIMQQDSSYSDYHSYQQTWFKYILPQVHPRFFHLVTPSPQPCIQLPGRTYEHDFQARLAYMSCPGFVHTLTHTRHLRINFEELYKASAGYSRQNPNDEGLPALTSYVAHIYLICLSAFNLETLEIGDLVLNEGDVQSIGGFSPFRLFSEVKPLQFDLSCSHLLKALPRIFTTVSESIKGPERANWEPDAMQHFLGQFHRIVQRPGIGRGLGFPHLKHVYLMDGNAGISIDDYADLFLVPRDLCMPSVADTDELSAARCEVLGDSCTVRTVCPALSSLTLVLWYGQLQIDPVFLHAMVHLVHHHPHLAHLNLISRRLRYEPRFLNPNVSLEQWFRFQVVPMLQLAQELLADKLKLTIYIITKRREEATLRGTIKTHWHAGRAINVETICVWDTSPEEVHARATDIHRTLCSKDFSRDKRQEHEPAWLDFEAVRAFFEGY